MTERHTLEWYCQSANKEMDEQGSRASILVDGLHTLERDQPTPALSEMVVITQDYFKELHTLEPNPPERLVSKEQLLHVMVYDNWLLNVYQCITTTLNICYFVISNVVNKGLNYDIYAFLFLYLPF